MKHYLALIQMTSLRKEAGQLLSKTLSFSRANCEQQVPRTFCSAGFISPLVSHHAQYLVQNLHVNTSSAACPLHGNPWKLDRQPTEFGSERNSTSQLAPGSQILLTPQVEAKPRKFLLIISSGSWPIWQSAHVSGCSKESHQLTFSSQTGSQSTMSCFTIGAHP